MIREVHVYGPALDLGEESQGEAQHMGLGSELIEKAKEISHAASYGRIAVISAIGTQQYYARHGFRNRRPLHDGRSQQIADPSLNQSIPATAAAVPCPTPSDKRSPCHKKSAALLCIHPVGYEAAS